MEQEKERQRQAEEERERKRLERLEAERRQKQEIQENKVRRIQLQESLEIFNCKMVVVVHICLKAISHEFVKSVSAQCRRYLYNYSQETRGKKTNYIIRDIRRAYIVCKAKSFNACMYTHIPTLVESVYALQRPARSGRSDRHS